MKGSPEDVLPAMCACIFVCDIFKQNYNDCEIKYAVIVCFPSMFTFIFAFNLWFQNVIGLPYSHYVIYKYHYL